MNRIPFRKPTEEVRALFIGESALCTKSHDEFQAREQYPCRLKYVCKLVMTDIGHLEVYERRIEVKGKEYELKRFAEHFETPDILSIGEVYPIQYAAYQKSVRIVYKVHGLNPYDFQIDDIASLMFKEKAILAYDQGLGKTIASLVWLILKDRIEKDIRKVLIIAQQDLITQWTEEASRVNLKLNRLTKHSQTPIEKYSITHFEYLSEYGKQYLNTFDAIILDEGHKIKSAMAQRAIAIRMLNAKYKLCLTGTPIKNIAKDLHFLIGWLYGYKNEMYKYAQNEQNTFRRDFGVYETKDGHRRLAPRVSNIHGLQWMLAPIMLRRETDDIGITMVKRNMYRLAVHFTPEQKQEYNRILNDENLNPTTKRWELRKNTAIYPNNNKLMILKRIIYNILKKEEKCIIFTAIIEVGEFYEKLFPNARLVNGNIPPVERERIIKDFKQGKFPILIGGIEAINTGHSLQVANNVIITDYVYTHSTLDQGVARVRRIVSKKDVNIFMLYTIGSYDEDMLRIVDAKRESSEFVLDNDSNYKFIHKIVA